jgi:hypothetical protein
MQEKAAYIRPLSDQIRHGPGASGGYVHQAALCVKGMMNLVLVVSIFI